MPYERPPLSKPQGGAVARKTIATPEDFSAQRITYEPQRSALTLDAAQKTVGLDDGRTLHFDRLLLVTGARPLPLAGALTLRSFDDAEAIFTQAQAAQSVAIIGAGLIGMELAAQLATQGKRVLVIDPAAQIMARAVPEALAETLRARHIAAGVALHLGATVAQFGPELTLSTGARVAADLVVAAIGVVPETALAEAAGLACAGGISVDARLASSAAGVFAAGDCAAMNGARFEMWQVARDMADHAARAMLGETAAFAPRPWFWSDHYEMSLQVLGQPAPEHQRVRRALAAGSLDFYLAQGRLVAVAGLTSDGSIGREIALARRIIEPAQALDPVVLQDPAIALKSFLR